jgi:autotransporter-associated beta strand protein
MKPRSNPIIALALAIASSTSLQAALYWNANSGTPDYSGSWNDIDSNWNTATAGTGTQTTWTGGEDAEFDADATYTVTIDAAQTATNLNITAGTLTFDGTNTAASNTLTIDSGASLTAASDRFLKSGTTTLTVDGTLTQTAAVSVNTQRVAIAGGSGSIVFSGGFRTAGDFNFAGNISGTGSIITDGGGTFTLSGDNTYAGDTLIRNGNTLRIGSSTALSGNSFLRFGGGTNIVVLTGTDFSRTAGTGAGNVRFHAGADGAGNSGFAAVDEDRTVAINGTVSWGAGLFNPGIFYLGTASSTHKVTLTTGIDLNGASRIIQSNNGSAEVEGEISGVISGGAGSILTKQGTGVLLLSGANTHAGGTTIAQSQGAINPLRISHADALGSGSLIIGGGGNNDQARLELTGGITVANPITALSTRSNNAPNIVNISGNNTISNNILAGSGGSRTTIESAADKLVLGGSVSVRQLNLFGEGEGEILGNVTVASTFILNKDGSGKWTIGGNMSNSTGTTIADGTLQIGNGGANGSLGVAPVTNNGELIFDRTGAVSIPGDISGSGTIIKRGTAEITLSGALSYSGTTTIEDGALVITGDASGATGAVSVGDGSGDPASAVLGGTGTIGGDVTLDSDGAIAPGQSAGTLETIGGVSGNGTLLVEIDGAEADQLIVGGTLDISAMTLDVSELSAPTETVYVIVNADSAISGAAFDAVSGLPAGYSVSYNYDDGIDTHNIALVGTPSSDPFENWATVTNGLAGADALPGADPDNDGLDNLVEFVIGGQPNPANPNANSSGLVPVVALDPSNLVFTYRRTALSATQPGLTVAAEYGSNLSGWTTAVDGVDGVAITTTPDGFGAGVDRVDVSIPRTLATGDKLFARLKTVIP